MSATTLDLTDCRRCQACELALTRQQVVVSRGNPEARLMLIGEAPGAMEDATGQPFIGRSGQALNRLLVDVGLSPEHDLYICNAVKCRPPGNRRPRRTELSACRPWLDRQLELIDPVVIVLAGATALEAVLGSKGRMTDLRGRWQRWEGRDVMPIFHPSYLLRNPSTEAGSPVALTLSDLNAVRQRLCER